MSICIKQHGTKTILYLKPLHTELKTIHLQKQIGVCKNNFQGVLVIDVNPKNVAC